MTAIAETRGPGQGAAGPRQGRSRFVDADGLRLHCLEYGRGGQDVVAVPGIMSPGRELGVRVAGAGTRPSRCTLYLRGPGSVRPLPAGYGLDAYAADVAAVVHGLGLTRPVVLGHSMGGRIAAAVTARYRGLLAAVVVADPPLSGPGRPPYPFPLDVHTGALAAAEAGDLHTLARYFPSPNNVDIALRAAWLRSCDERAVVETYERSHTEDFFTDWPHVPPPALFVCGGGSPVIRSTELRESGRRIRMPSLSLWRTPAI